MAVPPATVVIGTAGHIDHGKTTLLRALTGIDADRLPEERERGMTIDVGFAHLDLDDGTSLDFVDVPGHDRLVGNMLVGAGEIDAVLLVVAADDGPRAQTREHLELLDALGLRHAVVAITKADVVDPARPTAVGAEVRRLLDATSLAGAPMVEVSATTGAGIAALRTSLVELRDAVEADRASRPAGPIRLPIDRAFTVRGRGLVVTGTIRGGPVSAGTRLRAVPGGGEARVREVQVHHGATPLAPGGRTALNLAGLDSDRARRGVVLTEGPGVTASDRLLVGLRPAGLGRPPGPSTALRFHLWTAGVEAVIRPTGPRPAVLDAALTADGAEPGDRAVSDGDVAALVSLTDAIAVMPGAHAVLRDPATSRTVAAVTVLDPAPPRGVSRRRLTAERLGALASAIDGASRGRSPGAVVDALVELHGLLSASRVADVLAAFGPGAGGRAPAPPRPRLADDVAAVLASELTGLAAGGATIAEARAALLRRLRRLVSVDRSSSAEALAAVDALLEAALKDGRIRRDGERLGAPADAATDEASRARAAAGDRLEAALDVDVPPSLSDAARAAGCPPDAVVALERAGRIVRVEDDLAWATSRYLALRDRAVAMARHEPLTPAGFRDAIGGNRRVVMPLLEDFGRKGFLRRTEAGHVPGPRA